MSLALKSEGSSKTRNAPRKPEKAEQGVFPEGLQKKGSPTDILNLAW